MVQFVMEIELSEQCVTRLFASSSAGTSALRSIAPSIDEGHLGGILCSEAKSDSDLPPTIILKSESYNLINFNVLISPSEPVTKSWWLVPSITL